jgi:formylglycine-generating enzyme required for sulfatase activity
MKYEISQGQYRDFLNTLTRDQQNARTASDISGTSVTNRYLLTNTSAIQLRNGLRCDASLPASGPIEVYCDLDGDGIKNESTDGEWLACYFLSWADGAAYLDWSGLRPLTELEYEKVCRGPSAAVAGEYAWGTTGIAVNPYTLSAAGQATEGIGVNYSATSGNASYVTTDGSIDGPLRVGIFAANGLNTGRVSSGAGYYGAMELSGNCQERPVTIGNAAGRNYTGMHGNGMLTANGIADVLNWPNTTGSGAGFRGGDYGNSPTALRVSDRLAGSLPNSDRIDSSSIRGCRSVKPSAEGY